MDRSPRNWAKDCRTGAKKFSRTIFRWRGSVLPIGALFALPGTLVAAILHATWNPDVKGTDNVEVSRFGDVWTAYTFSLGFLVVFRNNQAYNRFWEGASKVHEIRGELQNCAGTLVAFSSLAEEKKEEVADFQNLLIRLFSLLFASCMRDICEDEDEDFMQVIDLTGIDRQSLDHLELAPNRCEVVVQWITRLMIESLREGVLDIPPPILNRSLYDLAHGIVDINRVRKIREVPFPFPYAQMVLLMLCVYSLMTPLLASQLIQSPTMAVVATFLVTAAFWALYYIADEIDQPFGTDPNDLPMEDMQEDFNKSLLFLMQPKTQATPSFVRPKTVMRLTRVHKRDHSSRHVEAAQPIPTPLPAVPKKKLVRKKRPKQGSETEAEAVVTDVLPSSQRDENGCIRSESPPRVHLDTPVGDRVMLLDYPKGKGETLRVRTFVAERPGVLGKSFPVS